MSNNFQALEIYVQANIASCVLGRPKCFRRPKTTYRHPTLPFFSIRDRTIGVGPCDNLANEQIKVSFY